MAPRGVAKGRIRAGEMTEDWVIIRGISSQPASEPRDKTKLEAAVLRRSAGSSSGCATRPAASS